MNLSWRAIVIAAAVIVVTVVGAVLAVRAGTANESSNLNLVVILVLFVVFPVGGAVAYRVAGRRPLAHAAAAAGLAWVAIALSVVSRGFTLARLITLVLLVQVTVGLALLGSWVSYRRRTSGAVGP